MKYIAIILLIVVGVYLYKRAQRLAQEEQREAQRAAEKIVPLEDEVVTRPAEAKTPVAEPSAVEESAAESETVTPEPVNEAKAMDESWANDKLASALIEFRNATTAEEKHGALLQAVGECYKQRKEKLYCEYGAGLSRDYQETFAQLASPDNEKGAGFMQLATLLNDCGQFDEAIAVCQAAMGYGLTDGTVTGFEGRVARIEKAKQKADK